MNHDWQPSIRPRMTDGTLLQKTITSSIYRKKKVRDHHFDLLIKINERSTRRGRRTQIEATRRLVSH
jgi:hypothetical protein